jgi:hypothetical protein
LPPQRCGFLGPGFYYVHRILGRKSLSFLYHSNFTFLSLCIINCFCVCVDSSATLCQARRLVFVRNLLAPDFIALCLYTKGQPVRGGTSDHKISRHGIATDLYPVICTASLHCLTQTQPFQVLLFPTTPNVKNTFDLPLQTRRVRYHLMNLPQNDCASECVF